MVLQVHLVMNQLCHMWGTIHSYTISWLNQCAIDLNLEDFSQLVFILWNIWKERNERLWNQKNMGAYEVCMLLKLKTMNLEFIVVEV